MVLDESWFSVSVIHRIHNVSGIQDANYSGKDVTLLVKGLWDAGGQVHIDGPAWFARNNLATKGKLVVTYMTTKGQTPQRSVATLVNRERYELILSRF